MSEEKPLKSAYEIAMERLRKQDEADGVEMRRLTDQQKAAVADARSFYTAKLAEQEVLHQSKLRQVAEPAERAKLEAEYRHDRERLSEERDRRIEKIRRGVG